MRLWEIQEEKFLLAKYLCDLSLVRFEIQVPLLCSLLLLLCAFSLFSDLYQRCMQAKFIKFTRQLDYNYQIFPFIFHDMMLVF
jgi:hypothetical protein